MDDCYQWYENELNQKRYYEETIISNVENVEDIKNITRDLSRLLMKKTEGRNIESTIIISAISNLLVWAMKEDDCPLEGCANVIQVIYNHYKKILSDD